MLMMRSFLAFWLSSTRQWPASPVVPVFPPVTVTFSGAVYAVSYTHLDVYKRQAEECERGVYRLIFGNSVHVYTDLFPFVIVAYGCVTDTL